MGAGREGGGEAEPGLGGGGQGGSQRDPPLPHQAEHRGPKGEVQAATDLVQHLDTVQHVTVQYSAVQVQYSTVQEVRHLKSGSEHSNTALP